MLSYKGKFDPWSAQVLKLEAEARQQPAAQARGDQGRGDRRDGWGYVYTQPIVLRVNVALATGRPLLISGPTGSGKSSLAFSVARLLGWRYYEHVVTSRTQARDLLWRFDALRRLSDAEINRIKPQQKHEPEGAAWQPEMLAPYIDPGVLWWAFDQQGAKRRGVAAGHSVPSESEDLNRNERAATGPAVVLIDEIDKADPDVPNDLLVPLGSLEFRLEETGWMVKVDETQPSPLIIITTNGERALPAAFLRRCLAINLPAADDKRLVDIAVKRFEGTRQKASKRRLALYEQLAKMVVAEGKNGDPRQPAPSTAEFLDTVRACLTLGVWPARNPQSNNTTWNGLLNATFYKKEGAAEAQADR